MSKIEPLTIDKFPEHGNVALDLFVVVQKINELIAEAFRN